MQVKIIGCGEVIHKMSYSKYKYFTIGVCVFRLLT